MVIGVPISLGIVIFLSEIGPVDALPLRIWRLVSQPWGAALVLILIVFILKIVLRLLSQ
jgi:phosphate transport system permease protein